MQHISTETLAVTATPKRIVFYSHTGQMGGAERMLLLTLTNLDQNHFRPIVVCPAEGGLQQACETIGVPTHSTDSIRARFTWRPDRAAQYVLSIFRSSVRARRLFRRLEPDLVHANSIRAGIVASTALLRSRIPVLWHIQDILRPHPISSFIRIFAVLCRRASFIACSESAARAFRGNVFSRFRSKAVSVAFNGIEITKFAPPNARAAVRRELNLGEEHFLIAIVGQIAPLKGQERLIRAFAEFRRRSPQARLLIVGRPACQSDEIYQTRLKQLCENLELTHRVCFLGQRSDIPSVMKSIDLLVLNSDLEAFGLVILEAMLEGTPVLTTASGGPAEIIAHGVTGHIIPCGDEHLLESALFLLASDVQLRRKYAANGVEHVVSRFSAQTYGQTIHELYGKLVSTARPSKTLRARSGPVDSLERTEHV